MLIFFLKQIISIRKTHVGVIADCFQHTGIQHLMYGPNTTKGLYNTTFVYKYNNTTYRNTVAGKCLRTRKRVFIKKNNPSEMFNPIIYNIYKLGILLSILFGSMIVFEVMLYQF